MRSFGIAAQIWKNIIVEGRGRDSSRTSRFLRSIRDSRLGFGGAKISSLLIEVAFGGIHRRR